MIKPLSPVEAIASKITIMPDFVIQAFNNLILKNVIGGTRGARATFTQEEVIGEILANRPEVTREEIFGKRWLDVEDVYAEQGWAVEYDKPGYNETYPATFTFKKK